MNKIVADMSNQFNFLVLMVKLAVGWCRCYIYIYLTVLVGSQILSLDWNPPFVNKKAKQDSFTTRALILKNWG
jgi:hypothetical protein